MNAKHAFALLVGLAGCIEGVLAWLVSRALVAQLPCHLPLGAGGQSDVARCLIATAGMGRRGFALALLGAGVVLTSLVLAGVELARQLLGLRRLRGSFRTLRRGGPYRWPSGHRASRVIDSARSRQKVVVIESDLLVCACIGYLRPRIVVSSHTLAALSDGELAAVLDHELRHLQARDPLRLLVGLVATRALFFVPMLREFNDAARVAMEVSADAAAVTRSGTEPLLHALVRFLSAPGPALGGSVSPMAGADVVEQRIAALEGTSPTTAFSLPRIALSAALVALLVATAALVPVSGSPPRPLPFHRVSAGHDGRAYRVLLQPLPSHRVGSRSQVPTHAPRP